jgi:hypothetical protein
VLEHDGSALSEQQAFEAMRRFLEEYWQRFNEATVSDVLSDTQPAFLADTVTADPAAWQDWIRIVRGVLASPE